MDDVASQKRTRGNSEEAVNCSSGNRPGRNERGNWKRHRSTRESRTPEGSLTYLVFHEVQCEHNSAEHSQHPDTALFLDPPQLFSGDCKASPLHGKDPIQIPLEEYLDDRPEVTLTVVKRYNCETYHEAVRVQFTKLPLPHLAPADAQEAEPYYTVLMQPGPLAVPISESMTLSLPLLGALQDLHANDPSAFIGFLGLKQNQRAPYLHFYHSRDAIEKLSLEILDDRKKAHTTALLAYLENWFGPDFEEADDLFERGVTTLKHLPKLFPINEIIVKLESGQPRGVCVTGCMVTEAGVHISATTWSFDGAFKQTKDLVPVLWPKNKDDEVIITDLSAYPLRYDTSGLKKRLLTRGTMLWLCRGRRLVSYAPPRRTFEIRVVNPRYMVDMETYRQLHEREADEHQDGLDESLMDVDTPPSDEFVLQLPPQVLGFGLHDKKWRSLLVEYIQDISWNKAAFDRLVLNPDKKSLITAMVKEHVLSDTSADIIEGKGNGLIILLHGGPGTGKTLTAESVAELAEKPLYRVTCGDIGTNPEGVEKYLDSVLYIGTVWKAVVLFDESDVFLEERSQADLQRNALVSVFLRVLEYYDGILILTSNRGRPFHEPSVRVQFHVNPVLSVGTFDEAFKSRVHLALHYPAIDEAGRREIWHDFFQDLERQGADATHEQLKSKIGVLAIDNLNGRQIRNSIRAARQLASQSKEPMSYNHVRQAIAVAQEFEQYVVKTHGGNTHEDFAAAQNIRYH